MYSVFPMCVPLLAANGNNVAPSIVLLATQLRAAPKSKQCVVSWRDIQLAASGGTQWVRQSEARLKIAKARERKELVWKPRKWWP
jgi:hypothetical protein